MKVERTFVFVDLSGFTKYTAANGDLSAGEILTRFRAKVRDVAAQCGVRVDKWLGDGCMIVAVDQKQAVSFALDLRKQCADVCAPLKLRTGIATGQVLMFQGEDYIGSSVNQASRLCDAAGDDEILAARQDLLPTLRGVHLKNHEPVTLRGLGELDVVSLVAERSLGGLHDTGELWTRGPFV
ncbi:MAG: adenylate/guanylate cyclase domain-containing protein [Actinomycetota bacterium]